MYKRLLLRVITILAVAGAAYLLYRTLKDYTFDEIYTALRGIPFSHLALGLAFAAGSYLCLSCFDALAVRYVGKPLGFHKTLLTSFVSLSIGHNVGVAALSSGAVRYRYYSRWGLSAADVALVIVFCGVTVALGLMTVGAGALLLRPQEAAEMTGLSQGAVLAFATIAGVLPIVYFVCAALVRQPFKAFKREFRLPTLPIATAQVLVGALNFACVAASLHQMLTAFAEASYLKVAAVSIIANIAAIISHVPGGIGVLEATVVHILPGAESVAAVIAFRVIYYFIPLALGLVMLAISEIAIKPSDKARQVLGEAPQHT